MLIVTKDGHQLRITVYTHTVYEEGNLTKFGVAPGWKQTTSVVGRDYSIDDMEVSQEEFYTFLSLGEHP